MNEYDVGKRFWKKEGGGGAEKRNNTLQVVLDLAHNKFDSLPGNVVKTVWKVYIYLTEQA